MRLRDFTKELDCKYIINSTIGFQPRVVDSTREAAYGCRFDLGTNFWTKELSSSLKLYEPFRVYLEKFLKALVSMLLYTILFSIV